MKRRKSPLGAGALDSSPSPTSSRPRSPSGRRRRRRSSGRVPLALRRAVLADDGETVALLVTPADIKARDDQGLTLLHLAAAAGAAASVKELVAAGSDCNATDNAGDTPLHLAAASGHLNVVRALVEQAETNVWATSRDGLTAAQAAEAAGKGGVLTYFRRTLRIFSGIPVSASVLHHGRLSVCDGPSDDGIQRWRPGLTVVLSSDKGFERLIWYGGAASDASGSVSAVSLSDVRAVEWEEGGGGGEERRGGGGFGTLARMVSSRFLRSMSSFGGSREFSLVLRSGRRLPFAAASGIEARGWVRALRRATETAIARLRIAGAMRTAWAKKKRKERKRQWDCGVESIGRVTLLPTIGLLERRTVRLDDTSPTSSSSSSSSSPTSSHTPSSPSPTSSSSGTSSSSSVQATPSLGWVPRFYALSRFFLVEFSSTSAGWAVARHFVAGVAKRSHVEAGVAERKRAKKRRKKVRKRGDERVVRPIDEWQELCKALEPFAGHTPSPIALVFPTCAIRRVRVADNVVELLASFVLRNWPAIPPPTSHTSHILHSALVHADTTSKPSLLMPHSPKAPSPFFPSSTTGSRLVLRSRCKLNAFLPELLLQMEPVPASILAEALMSQFQSSGPEEGMGSVKSRRKSMAIRKLSTGSTDSTASPSSAAKLEARVQRLASADALGRGRRRRHALQQLGSVASLVKEATERRKSRMLGVGKKGLVSSSDEEDSDSDNDNKEKKEEGGGEDDGRGVGAMKKVGSGGGGCGGGGGGGFGGGTKKALQRLMGKDGPGSGLKPEQVALVWSRGVVQSVPSPRDLLDVTATSADSGEVGAGRSFAAAAGLELGAPTPADAMISAVASSRLNRMDAARWSLALLQRSPALVAATLQIQQAARTTFGAHWRSLKSLRERHAGHPPPTLATASSPKKSKLSRPTPSPPFSSSSPSSSASTLAQSLKALAEQPSIVSAGEDETLGADVISRWIAPPDPSIALASAIEEAVADLPKDRDDARRVLDRVLHAVRTLKKPPPPPPRKKPAVVTPKPIAKEPPKPPPRQSSAADRARAKAIMAKLAAKSATSKPTSWQKPMERKEPEVPDLKEEEEEEEVMIDELVEEEEEEEEEEDSSGEDSEEETEYAKALRLQREQRKDPRMDPKNWEDEVQDDGSVKYRYLPTGELADLPPWRAAAKSRWKKAGALASAASAFSTSRTTSRSSSFTRAAIAAATAPREPAPKIGAAGGGGALARFRRASNARINIAGAGGVTKKATTVTAAARAFASPRRIVRRK